VRFEVEAGGWHHVAAFKVGQRVPIMMAVGLNRQAWSTNAGSGCKGQWRVLSVWSEMRYGEEGGGLRCSGEGVLVRQLPLNYTQHSNQVSW
jgi:hypothetical protein